MRFESDLRAGRSVGMEFDRRDGSQRRVVVLEMASLGLRNAILRHQPATWKHGLMWGVQTCEHRGRNTSGQEWLRSDE